MIDHIRVANNLFCNTFVITVLFACIWLNTAHAGPFAPAAGQPGSTAIAMDDVAIVGWATGWSNYRPGLNLDENWKTPDRALGPAAGNAFDIVGLGAGGEITLIFNDPIVDGPGADFAVFENSFSDVFIELAYIEVSADGEHFVRFPSQSLTPAPVAAYGTIDPTDIDGFGGKYRQGFGTPFDLADVGLSVATCVRVIDVVGNATYADSYNHIIYDPYPTAGSAGFDLEAVGALHAGIGPRPDIQVNGSDGPITIDIHQAPMLTVTLAANSLGAVAADWWIVAYHHDRWESFGGMPAWLPDFPLTPCLQYPLVDIAAAVAIPINPLATPGAYVFFFAVDTHANGLLDLPLYYDFVTVTVE